MAAGQAGRGWEWGARPWPAGSCSSVHTLQLVKQCRGAHKMERTEQVFHMHTQLDFSKVKVGTPIPHSPGLLEARYTRLQAWWGLGLWGDLPPLTHE